MASAICSAAPPILVVLMASTLVPPAAWTQDTPTPPGSPAAIPAPLNVPQPGPATDAPYAPQPILPGGVVVTLYPPDSPLLNKERIKEPEQYRMTRGAPGRIQSIVNIHNPSIEVHTVEPGINTGAAVILAAGGGHRTLNVGTESGDFVHYFYNFGVNSVILRNRLRSDGYNPQTDAVNDALQAIRMVRANAEQWGIDPHKIGVMGFSAGAELAAPAAILFDEFNQKHNDPADPLAGISSRPDFVALLYPGPTPFARGGNPAIPRNAPPTFIATAGSGDRVHAIWATEYFLAMLQAGIPNTEFHVYGNGVHANGLKDRTGTPFGTWQERFIDWFRDLGFLREPGLETKAAQDVTAFVNQPPRGQRGGRRGERDAAR
jgi:endo-1,4-beta-xylanase